MNLKSKVARDELLLVVGTGGLIVLLASMLRCVGGWW